MSFKFLNYSFDNQTGIAKFSYQGKDEIIFTETIDFTPSTAEYNPAVLDSALFFASIVIGTSYYKADPTATIELSRPLSKTAADFFNQIYQDGLSQFAFENHLTRDELAHFTSNTEATNHSDSTPTTATTLALISGGKDSLLAAELLNEKQRPFKAMYVSSGESYPTILNDFDNPIIISRHIDKENLRKADGKNGHVPVTLIIQAIALIQAVLLGYDSIELGIGKEGLEPHAWIKDLPVNHQWSKTETAQNLLQQYVASNITTDIKFTSSLAGFTELEIAKQFAEKCWDKYGDKFSSCNVANYKQGTNNHELKWCGKCAKCANSYLLFAPFIPYEKQYQIFGRDLFTDPEMTDFFKGLLNVDGVIKPFECVASYDELKWAYQHKLAGYGDLPFEV
ncbi:hypothetical protein IJG26_01840 [Candidatus Saccharibacteria bacterium]|nr:hypothetical protein [Candidatus Saccharibacteria bacterium]